MNPAAHAARPAGALAVARVELAKAARQPSSYVMLAIVLGYAIVLTLGIASALKAPAGQGFDASSLLTPLRADAVGFLTEILTSIALIVLVVFVTQMVGQEFSRGTLRTLLVSRARRMDVYLGKTLAMAAVAVLAGVVVVAAGLASAAVLSTVSGEALVKGDAADLSLLAARTVADLGLWGLIALGTAFLVRSPGVAVGATLGGLLVGDIMRGFLASIGRVGVWTSQALPNTAIAHFTSSTRIAADEWLWIIPNLLVWVVGLNAWAARRLHRADIIGATK